MDKKKMLLIIICLLLAINIVMVRKKRQHLLQKSAPPTQEQPTTPESPKNEEPPKVEPKLPEKIEPKWTDWPAVRQVSNLGKVLSDIESHMPAGHIYKDSDKITWAHETTHGINSNIRQKFSGSEVNWGRSVWREIDGKPVFHAGRVNGFYCLDNKAAVINEPNVRIQTVAAAVPQSLRGPVYSLYLVQQAQSWGDTPLYIMDEGIAYQNGSACRLDLGIQERSETVSQMMEFVVYGTTLAMIIKKQDSSYDDQQFKAFLMWFIERAFNIYKGEERAKPYLEAFKTSNDATSLREFAKSYYGEEWTKIILGF